MISFIGVFMFMVSLPSIITLTKTDGKGGYLKIEEENV